MDELRAAVRRLASIESGNGHGGHRGEHAALDCKYCCDWMLAVIDVWDKAERQWGPPNLRTYLVEALKGGI